MKDVVLGGQKMIKIRVMDATGDTLTAYPTLEEATKGFDAMSKTHMGYDADTNTIIHGITEDTSNVVMHRKLAGG